MAKRRRKLSSELENEISLAKRKVEFITAIINDIEDEAIQIEYRNAFDPVRNAYLFLSTLYDQVGFNEDSIKANAFYNSLVLNFESEYEI